jgi:hypothetical protein
VLAWLTSFDQEEMYDPCSSFEGWSKSVERLTKQIEMAWQLAPIICED